MNNNNDFNALSQVLSRQLEIQSHMLALEESKKKVLIAGDIGQLDEIIRQQTPLVLNCSSLENQREQIITRLGLKDIPFSQVVVEYAAAYDETIKTTFEDLVDILVKLKKVNDLNERILQSRLARIQHCFAILGVQDHKLTYDQEGRF